MAEAVAHSNYVRHSAQKVMPVLDLIRRKNAHRALVALEFLPKRSADFIAKTIASAVSNLGQQLGKKMDPKDAWVRACWVNAGPVLKRIHAGSMGRAMPYTKKTCHLTVKVADQP